ncbi:hypothetical protein PPACK8108_LOCUS1047 [Phakopsora pachyrhizi]|uniref:Uncharacterized protein n=1 Tax=Phakopsora pachyrhizi TaxID=170000 RepID=A0AAV0AIX5_PHAPC|nr:hypothetical protein PPACK8108_LOCUS1047 [Phakopsora pachyrhizi]
MPLFYDICIIPSMWNSCQNLARNIHCLHFELKWLFGVWKRPSKQMDQNRLSQAPAEQREIDREIDKGRSPGIQEISLQISKTDDEQKLFDPKDEKLLMITNVASEDWGTIQLSKTREIRDCKITSGVGSQAGKQVGRSAGWQADGQFSRQAGRASAGRQGWEGWRNRLNGREVGRRSAGQAGPAFGLLGQGRQ